MLPLVFTPYLRPLVWGDRRLATRLNKPLPPTGSYGESWEVSGHASHVSVVAEGEHAGRSLADLCRDHARALYGRQPAQAVFPLLIKYLDAADWLSVQVHPDDALAAQLSPGERGKTEAWLIVSVEPGAKVWAGLKEGVTRVDLERHLDAGTVVEVLHEVLPRPGDCLFFPAGTVHAVGGGVVFAEVQQTSDATYRLFDWNRVQPDGTRRPLHREQSLAAIDWTRGPVTPVVPRPLAEGEALVACQYFDLARFRLTQPLTVPCQQRLSLWLVLDGAATLHGAGYTRAFDLGTTVLVPASAPELTWTPGPAGVTLLRVLLPDV